MSPEAPRGYPEGSCAVQGSCAWRQRPLAASLSKSSQRALKVLYIAPQRAIYIVPRAIYIVPRAIYIVPRAIYIVQGDKFKSPLYNPKGDFKSPLNRPSIALKWKCAPLWGGGPT